MRPALLLGGLLALFAGAVIAVAQTGPGQTPPPALKEMTITQDTEVRSGGSPDYYATGKLRTGDKVQVIGESTKFKGWLAIKPPAGSFSWINALFVKYKDKYSGVVVADPQDREIVPVLAGSAVVQKRPNVEAVKVGGGLQVVILGAPMYAEDGAWLPIEPTPQEVRYIPADSVRGSTAVPVAASPPPTPGAGAFTAAPVSPARALRDRADQAFNAGNMPAAKALYEQAASQTTDNQEKSYCYNRLHQIDTANRGTGYAQPGHPANAPAGGRTPGQTTSLYGTAPAGQAPQAAPATQVAYSASPPQWSNWGSLQKTSIPSRDGRPMYALVGRDGQVIMYAFSPNVSLDHYVNRMVCLYGPVSYSPGEYLRINYMTVSHVALP